MIFDTHAHYDDKQFDQDREELLASMKDNGIGTIVDVGSNMETSTWIVEAVTRYPMMYGAVGVHPSDTAELKESDIDTLKKYAAMDRILAIGEIGLDYFRKEGHACKDTQKYWFRQQLDLAVELEKPFIIHSRDAAEDTMEILQEFGKAHPDIKHPGVIHCYSYSPEMAKEYIAMGYYIGIGGVVTFKNAKKLVETAKEIPLERILVETDSPYLCPEPNRGKRNDSSQIRYVIDKIAAIRGILPEEVEKQTEINARNMYGLLQ